VSAADYVSAVSTSGPSLRGRVLDAIWDDQLSSQMRSRGEAVLEESVLGLLIGDLESGSEDGEHSAATPSPRRAGETAARLVRGG